ncbi:hypothetical protein BHE74_00033194 [Ensete ventricosum]|nr:hypothetical protein BHE74_00033194 [Ensete ventricosum]RZS09233.1 hypothetical protein BHM03_00040290 [Ensete ventricosum]
MAEPTERQEIEKGEDLEEPMETGALEFKRVPPWSKQITVRGLVASLVIGVMYSVIVMKLNLTTGLVPTLNVSAALLAFVILRSWTKLLHKIGILTTPFTRQENTVVQTCAVACYSIAVGDQANPVLDDLQRNDVFMKESIPVWLAYAGYALFAVVSIIAIPIMFPEVKWYYVVIAYMLAPALGFCNAYGAGLTDMNMAYNYGKVSLFILAALAGKHSGVVAGLVGCGLIKSVVSISADLMHDFKTGHLTMTSPRSMLLSQAIGTAIGCVVAPLTFFLFYKAFDIGNPDGNWKAPYALIYRNMAILGVEGFSALPHHCLQLCYGFFGFAVVTNTMRDILPAKYSSWVPLPMAMAVPFLVGASFAIDMCVGSLVVFAWHKLNRKKAALMVPAVASGLICGDGLWILPSSLLALAKVNPPICMKFLAA